MASSDDNILSDVYDYNTPDEDHLIKEEVMGVYYIVIFFISAPGNSFLLWVLLRERGWKNTPDNLILQLTVSALCFTVTLPFWACERLYSWVFGKFACGVIGGATNLGTNSCVAIITAMTFYHYVAVDHASCLSAQASKKLLLLTSTVIWLICSAASIRLSMNFCTEEIRSGFMSCFYFNSYNWMIYYVLIQCGLFFLIPFIIILFCYVYRATKQSRINRQHQAPRLILRITIGLFFCLGPYYVLVFIYSLEWFGIVESIYMWLPSSAWFIISFLPQTHCCLNLFHICGAQRFSRYLCMPCGTSPQRRDEGQEVITMAVMLQNDISV